MIYNKPEYHCSWCFANCNYEKGTSRFCVEWTCSKEQTGKREWQENSNAKCRGWGPDAARRDLHCRTTSDYNSHSLLYNTRRTVHVILNTTLMQLCVCVCVFLKSFRKVCNCIFYHFCTTISIYFSIIEFLVYLIINIIYKIWFTHE